MCKNIISPSILSANFADLKSELALIPNADMLHIDVMDGHFVPNISVGIPIVASLKLATHIALDVHLMISEPLRYVKMFADAGADLICFHVESESDIKLTIAAARAAGVRVGLALKPATPASAVAPFLSDIDLVLIMTVEPGFGGQSFMPDMLSKIQAVHDMLVPKYCHVMLQVDGGINLDTAKLCVDSGANVLVAGTFILNSSCPSTVIEQLKTLR